MNSTTKKTGNLSVFDVLKLKKKRDVAKASNNPVNAYSPAKETTKVVDEENLMTEDVINDPEKSNVAVTEDTLRMLSKIGKKQQEDEDPKEKAGRKKGGKKLNKNNNEENSNTKKAIKVMTDGMIESPELLKEMKEKKKNRKEAKKLNETKNKGSEGN